jgi:hypothetical protein
MLFSLFLCLWYLWFIKAPGCCAAGKTPVLPSGQNKSGASFLSAARRAFQSGITRPSAA